MADLLPCPFCGNKQVAQGASRDYISVWCFCGARGPEVPFPEYCDPIPPIKECHAAWNRRVPAERGEAGVTVRPLEWRFFDVSHDFGKGVWDANSDVVTYTIECCGEKYPDEPFYLKKVSKTFTDLGEAKATAQSDYERRILSALALPEKGLDERTVEGGE